MVKKMLFAVAILALAILGPGAGLLEARPWWITDLCYPETPCVTDYYCGVVNGLPQGVCHNGSCICY